MSTTLHERPPHQVAEQHLPARESAPRPSALDRLALRVGLLLITYGRRRYATPRDLAKAQRAQRRVEAAYAQQHSERARVERELTWSRARWAQRPHA
jgi:hypothetical protein